MQTQNVFGSRGITPLVLCCLVGLGVSCGGMEEYEGYEEEGEIERSTQSFKGTFKRDGNTYYSNGRGAYCLLRGGAKILSDFKRFDGICKGDFILKGRGGYSNGRRHLCWYSSPRWGNRITKMPGNMKDDGFCK